jgi:hypothetical protein
MEAWIIQTGAVVSPFGDPPREAQFAMQTIGQAVDDALIRRGLSVHLHHSEDQIDGAATDILVLADHCYVSDKCVGDFLGQVFGEKEILQLALGKTVSSEYTLPTSSVGEAPMPQTVAGAKRAKASGAEQDATHLLLYDCFYVPAGTMPSGQSALEMLATLREKASPRYILKREIGVDIRLPLLGNKDDTHMVFPITSTVACHVETWVHILWLNHLAFGIRFMELARAHKLWAFGRLLRSFPPTLPRLMKSCVRVGRNVEIHKTAYVEASILGDGVKIGPRACVRNSILAPGVEVGDHASVIACTVGENAFVTPKSFFVWSTAYPEAVISNYKMQMSVMGKGAASSTWAGLIDAKFQGYIHIMHKGQALSTERRFLGSCLGHGAYVGAKALLHPGRALPNKTYLTMRPDELIETIPDDLKPGVPVVREGGTLVPLEALRTKATTG